MKTRVDFPDGTHAILREKINVRGRKALERTQIPALKAMRRIRQARLAQEIADGEEPSQGEIVTYTEEEIYAMQRMEFAGVMALLAHWNRDEPVPRTIDEVEDMENEVYEPLALEVRPRLWELLVPTRFDHEAAVNGKGEVELDSPTGPSNGSSESDSVSRATPQQTIPVQVIAPSETGSESGSSVEGTPESPTNST